MADHWGLVGGSTIQKVLATDWRVPTQAAPTTVPASKPATATAFSNADNSYTSTTLGKKTLIAFPQTTLAANSNFIINFQGSNLNASFTALLTLKAAGVSGFFNGMVGLSLITASWTPSTITWNGIAGLTLSTRAVFNVQAIDVSLTTNPTVGDYIQTDGGIDVPAVFTGKISASPLTIYGLLIDVAPQNSWAAQAGQPESAQITYSVSSLLPPYLITGL